MKKFTVYQYDGEFYSEEYLKETGFQFCYDMPDYYAIAYNEETCIFSSEEERDAEYRKLELLLEKEIRELVNVLVNSAEWNTESKVAGEEERNLQNNFQKQYTLSKNNKLK